MNIEQKRSSARPRGRASPRLGLTHRSWYTSAGTDERALLIPTPRATGVRQHCTMRKMRGQNHRKLFLAATVARRTVRAGRADRVFLVRSIPAVRRVAPKHVRPQWPHLVPMLRSSGRAYSTVCISANSEGLCRRLNWKTDSAILARWISGTRGEHRI